MAVKAYELYERRGRGPGQDVADWLEAERLFVAELNSQDPKKPRSIRGRRRSSDPVRELAPRGNYRRNRNNHAAREGVGISANFGKMFRQTATLEVANGANPYVIATGILSGMAGDNIGYCVGRGYGYVAIERFGRWFSIARTNIRQ